MRFHICAHPRHFLSMSDEELARTFPEIGVAKARSQLLELARRGHYVPGAGCDNQDETGRCQGHDD